MRGATIILAFFSDEYIKISIHAPRERSDTSTHHCSGNIVKFQSTLLVRGATFVSWEERAVFKFQSTLLVRGATGIVRGKYPPTPISIHAPRERSDIKADSVYFRRFYFNPRSSWEERRLYILGVIKMSYFNPRSSWEERLFCRSLLIWILHFNPRSSWEERLANRWRTGGNNVNFNPRSSWEERPTFASYGSFCLTLFQSTLLVRGATYKAMSDEYKKWFQSTLLVRGATLLPIHLLLQSAYFNPRSSWEERLCMGSI